MNQLIVKYVGDYKERRRGLKPEVQTWIDNIVLHMQVPLSYFCELPVQRQDIKVNVDSRTRLRFGLLNEKRPTLYVMLTSGGGGGAVKDADSPKLKGRRTPKLGVRTKSRAILGTRT